MCIGKYNPDIIIGTETHLDSSVNSSELFPSNYSVIRKDRNFDNSKGGVLIAMKDDLIGTHRTDLDTKCEIVWVTIKIQGSNNIKRTNNEQIWLAGDFNLPDIDWDLLNTKPGGITPGLSKQLIEITNDFGLEQVVREPTRINNTLDLFVYLKPNTC